MPFKWRGRYLCFFCGKSYVEYTIFKNHTNSHGPCTTKDSSLKSIKGQDIEIKIDVSEIVCNICSDMFNHFEQIVDHLIENHNIDYNRNIDMSYQAYRLIDFKCLHCEEQFKYFGYLVNHVNTTHPQKSFICDDCGLSFNKKRDLTLHMRSYHRVGGYPCDHCVQNFDNYYLLKRHKNNVHFRQCNNCGQKFASLSMLQKHIKLDHFPGDLNCNFCSKVFNSVQSLGQHTSKCTVRKLTQTEMISDLPESNKNQNLIRIRQNIQCVLNMSTAIPFKYFSKFTCFYCSKKFVEFDDLKDHTTADHPICELKAKYMRKCKGERVSVKIDVATLKCKICCDPFPELSLFIDHAIKEHKADYDITITNCLEPFKIIKDNMPCPKCSDKSFRYFGILQRHLNSDHSTNNKICDFCGKTFRNVTNLKVHLSYTHTGACECDVCGIKYKNQWCLARHKARVHNAKDYKCEKCSEVFNSQYQRQKHMIKEHDIGHKCTYCGKMFTRNSFMKDHIRRTHLKEKNVPCSVCNEMFFDNYLLKMHMVKHGGERKFACEVCGKAFLRKSNLTSHKEMHKKYGHLQIQS